MKYEMQAVILAAGEGKRVRPLTRSRPKALIPVANRPIIDYIVEALEGCGIREIIVVVGYRKEQVIRHLNTLDLPVEVVVQPKPLGTGNALLAAAPLIRDRFMVLPGDNYIDRASISRIKDEKDAVLVREHPYPSNFGVVTVRRGQVTSIVEKPEQAPSFTISTGIFSLTRKFLDYIQENDLTDAVSAKLAAGEPLKAIPAGDWQDALYPWDLLAMNQKLIGMASPEKGGTIGKNCMIQGAVRIGRGSRVGPGACITGPVVIGPECEIGPYACIMPNTSIGSRVKVEPFTLVGNSILMDDCTVGAHSRVTDSVIAEGCTLQAAVNTVTACPLLEIEGSPIRGCFGSILGEKVRAGPFTSFEGAIVGNNAVIAGRSLVTALRASEDGALVI